MAQGCCSGSCGCWGWCRAIPTASAAIILENLRTADVQQAHKADKIDFIALEPWPGELICAEGRYLEGADEKRAAIFIGPEFGTVTRVDLAAAREAAEADFDVLMPAPSVSTPTPAT